MFVLVAGRGQGKTTALVDWFFENPGYRGIIVANESIRRNTVRELARKAVELNIQRIDAKWLTPYVVAASNGFSMNGWLRGSHVREWAIDDTDQVLQTLFDVPIKYLTINATLVPRLAKGFVDGYFIDGREGELESNRALPHSTDTPANP